MFAAIAEAGAQVADTPRAMPAPDLPPPGNSHARVSKAVGWPGSMAPQAPDGFHVRRFAAQLRNPRSLYVLPNGDVLTAEAEPPNGGRISLLRDADHDGVAEMRSVFIADLDRPFGMALVGEHFYVATTDAVWRYRYAPGALRLDGPAQRILSLPAGRYNGHWVRNLVARADGSKLYVSIGSASNVADHGMSVEAGRACILECNPDGSGLRVYASGLRNPTALTIAADGATLWTAVNERDGLGDELVPDYLTHVVDGGFYGWPWTYWGTHRDPRLAAEPNARPHASVIVPDLSLGAHVAPLGIVFGKQTRFDTRYRNGIFVTEHGSWNRSTFAGYRVVFVPFEDGRPSAPPQDFLSGFIADAARNTVHGRPVGIAVTGDGALLVADDAAKLIWRVERAR